MIPKFRVWDKQTKSMWNIESWHVEDEYFDLIEPNKNVADPNANRVWRRESDVILMQSTGLFDKNGAEIWVGDILEVRDTSCFGGVYRGAVEYLDIWGVYGFNLYEVKVLSTNKVKKHSLGFLMKEFGNCFTLAEASRKSNYSYKVIGNVWEDGDLIESVEE